MLKAESTIVGGIMLLKVEILVAEGSELWCGRLTS